MAKLGLLHKPTFRKNYLNLALKLNLITMLNPDNPRSQGKRIKEPDLIIKYIYCPQKDTLSPERYCPQKDRKTKKYVLNLKSHTTQRCKRNTHRLTPRVKKLSFGGMKKFILDSLF